jgi:hypothetical protein
VSKAIATAKAFKEMFFRSYEFKQDQELIYTLRFEKIDTYRKFRASCQAEATTQRKGWMPCFHGIQPFLRFIGSRCFSNPN